MFNLLPNPIDYHHLCRIRIIIRIDIRIDIRIYTETYAKTKEGNGKNLSTISQREGMSSFIDTFPPR